MKKDEECCKNHDQKKLKLKKEFSNSHDDQYFQSSQHLKIVANFLVINFVINVKEISFLTKF